MAEENVPCKTQNMDDLYKILNCESSATQDEIKKAYQTLALKHHPDKTGTDNTNNSSAEFIKINRAWKVLGDPKLREQFDVRWAERCLVQAYPIQDTVDFELFEPVMEEVDQSDSNCVEELLIKTIKDEVDSKPTCNNAVDSFSDTKNSITDSKSSSKNVVEDSFNSKDNVDSKTSRECADLFSNTSRPGINLELTNYCVEDVNEADAVEDACKSDDVIEYVYSCRCGGQYVLTNSDVQMRLDLVCCDSCSLTVQVVYNGDS